MDKKTDKVVLVTGGSRGIGSGIVRVIAEAGYSVALTYNNNKEMAEKLIKDVGIGGGKVMAVPMSIEDGNSISRALKKVNEELGSVNILINNAGIAQEKPFLSITQQDFDSMMAVNLRGPFILCQAVIPEMVKRGWGRIVNISSIGGQWGGFNQVHYAAAKAGLINLTRSLARIYSQNGITSNAIAPGLIQTDMSESEINTFQGKEKIKNIPVGRLGDKEEIGYLVKYLISDEAAYITGQTINANGGMYFI